MKCNDNRMITLEGWLNARGIQTVTYIRKDTAKDRRSNENQALLNTTNKII